MRHCYFADDSGEHSIAIESISSIAILVMYRNTSALLQFCLRAYQCYFGSGGNVALGKCGPGEGARKFLQKMWLREGLGGVSGGRRRGVGGSVNVQSQEIIIPEASTKKWYGNRNQFRMEASLQHSKTMFRLHETTVSTSATKPSKITKLASKAGLLGSFLL